MILRNVVKILPGDMPSHPRRYCSHHNIFRPNHGLSLCVFGKFQRPAPYHRSTLMAVNHSVLYNSGSLMTPIVFVRLQNTPLNLLHCFISDSMSRHYNLSTYTEFWPSNILPRSGSLMSSPSECWQLTDYFVTG
jgi:hypothetical protein